jgi:hypothetical protein
MITTMIAMESTVSMYEAAHENAQRHRQLSCHGRRWS